MLQWVINKIVGSKHYRDLKRIRPLAERVNAIELEYQRLSDDQLRAKTDEFRALLAGGRKADDILCEAFAAVKSACRRLIGHTYEVCGHSVTWDMVPFDSQIIGAIALHQGKITEMATGEGKTLVATLPLYLNALTGKNVHLVTVNDYLARRDSQWMGPVFEFLGVSVGCIQNTMRPDERREQYARDITYGTNSEFGFDYLRDQGMAYRQEDVVQRGYYYAIVDEIDSILIDEARTPLIISGPVPESTHQYDQLKAPVERMVRKQRDLCTQFIQEAREFLEKGDSERAQARLYQARHGMPKNKQLLHMLEDTAVRKMVEQVELSMLSDMHKEQARNLREELFFTIDERGHDATLTEKGCAQLNPNDPDVFVMPDIAAELSALDAGAVLPEAEKLARRQEIHKRFAEKSERIHNVDQLIRAYSLYERDVEYVVQNNQVLIVDEFTGRILPGRRWSDGLHQAIEAKEGVTIEHETQTLATITIQNYFRMYEKLAGMTGTAETEANEFKDIYNLDVVVVPTNRPVRRIDANDLIFRTKREKFKAIIDEIADCHGRGQPVLVGTISVETSELLSRMLRRENIPHNVLNAKNHEHEAEIVMNAGQPGSVTIATNMAGRGTDIKLGPGVVTVGREIVESKISLDDKVGGVPLRKLLSDKPGGLRVIGSERHESRRIDRQLRGRCARQGDPGSSRFFISLEDDLMRLFGSDRIAGIMSRFGMEEGEPLEHSLLNRSVETAQRRVEQHNYFIRKRTLEYDDVMNKQREVIYGLRGDVVKSRAPREIIEDVVHDSIFAKVEECLAMDRQVEDVRAPIADWMTATFPVAIRKEELVQFKDDPETITGYLQGKVMEAYEFKIQGDDPSMVPEVERHIMLRAIDMLWQDYLRNMDGLRQGVGLRAYGQQDPLVEYKREAFEMFADLMENINKDIVTAMFRTTISFVNMDRRPAAPRQFLHAELSALASAIKSAAAQRGARTITGTAGAMGPGFQPESGPAEAAAPGIPVRRETAKVGRNDACPCGSGRKYKKCCGA